MNKKHYAQPTISVVELDMADIVCQSEGTGRASSVTGNVFEGSIESDFNYSGGAMAKQRNGIWDED